MITYIGNPKTKKFEKQIESLSDKREEGYFEGQKAFYYPEKEVKISIAKVLKLPMEIMLGHQIKEFIRKEAGRKLSQ